MNLNRMKVAIAALGMLAFATTASAAVNVKNWTGAPVTLTSLTDPDCQIKVTGVVQDNAGQPVRISYKNPSSYDRETFKLDVAVTRNAVTKTLKLNVDNVNPKESGNNITGAFQGSISRPGTVIKLTLTSCKFKY